jgi:hypothetical protein
MQISAAVDWLTRQVHSRVVKPRKFPTSHALHMAWPQLFRGQMVTARTFSYLLSHSGNGYPPISFQVLLFLSPDFVLLILTVKLK